VSARLNVGQASRLSSNISETDISETGATPVLHESIVRIIGEPTTPNEAATLAETTNINSNGGRSASSVRVPSSRKKAPTTALTAKFFSDDPKAAKPEQIIIQSKQQDRRERRARFARRAGRDQAAIAS